MPRSFVTGAAGFIGSNLAIELEKLGHEVVALDNLHSGTKNNLKNFKGKFLTLDISETLHLEGRFDYIFHQASITDPRYGNDKELYHKNVTGFENVLALAKRDGARLIYASTAGLYGNGPVPMHEDQPKECLTVYGKSKLKMDEIAEPLFLKMPLIGLRYFNVFGPGEAHKGRPASMVYHLWQQMQAGNRPRLFKWGEQKRDFIYIKDVIAANLCAMNGESGIYNVGSGIASTFKELVQALNQAMGLQLEPSYFDMPYDSKTYQADTQAHITKASEGIGFKTKWDLADSVRDYVAYLWQK